MVLMLEKFHCGSEHIRSQPIMKPTVTFHGSKIKDGEDKEEEDNASKGDIPGFYRPSQEEKESDNSKDEVSVAFGPISCTLYHYILVIFPTATQPASNLFCLLSVILKLSLLAGTYSHDRRRPN